MSFPVTGQPIRVVMIDGEPWFIVADVCTIIGRKNPTDAVKTMQDGQARTIDLRDVRLAESKSYGVSAGQKPYLRGNPTLVAINEAGLYSLLIRSNKPSARPFRRWVTEELLPSVRRGDTDVPRQQQRMAETLSEAIGQRVEILADIAGVDGGPSYHVRSDGTVHCRHGEMLYRVPSREEDSGPPFGAYYECPVVERVGIRGGTALPGCARLKLVDLMRQRDRPPAGPFGPPPAGGLLEWDLQANRVYGTAFEMAELLREMGQPPE
jgi:prophage antirepressor-like protein